MIKRHLPLVLLVLYMTIVLYLTVLGREPIGCYQYDLSPIRKIHQLFTVGYYGHGQYILREILLNILMFVPVGALLAGSRSRSHVSPSFSHLKPIIIGFCLSLTIELLQLLTCRGCCETNDLVHNTIGCAIGYGIVGGGLRRLRGRLNDNF